MRSRFKNSRGFTIAELSVSMGVFTLFGLGLGVTGVFISKTFNACVHSMDYSNQQMRITDYISLDLTRATAVQLGNNGTITMTLPNYYNTDGTPNDPRITGSTVAYGTADVTVRYYRQQNDLYRSCSNPSSTTLIASGISDLTCTPTDYGQSIEINTSFTPRFQWNNKANVTSLNTITSTTLMRNQRSLAAP